MSEDKSDRYIKIARACLRAINEVSRDAPSRDESVQKVYSAIEDAFNSEMNFYQEELAVLTSVLERIANGQLSLEKSRALAQETLRERQHWQDNSSQLH
ncbi:hypothetical protein [Mangrovitalea sediminis]|uniref:hypothetical protein n=1 Tax=Mangrovitalea sediminis TaxID=1982043 RepID=UPI000BE5D27B|nr:hypothetical protein [Mangrovitalea sediminis]